MLPKPVRRAPRLRRWNTYRRHFSYQNVLEDEAVRLPPSYPRIDSPRDAVAPVALHIPYRAQVAAGLVRTADGDYVQVFRLNGASFESADDADLNNWHERLNVTWRNLASPNVAIWTHIIRRRERASADPVSAFNFASQLALKYQQRLAGETLMVNEIYLSLVYRPVAGTASPA